MNKYQRAIHCSASKILKQDIDSITYYTLSGNNKSEIIQDACKTLGITFDPSVLTKTTVATTATDLAILVKTCESNI